jgi:HTH-type transcriptional regulator / antitoxin HigA
MTTTINLEAYTQLLTQYQPRVITTEAENEAAIAVCLELEHRARSPEEDSMLALLVTLIEKFETEHYPIPPSSPHSILKHLMEEAEVKQEDLVGVIGSRGVVSEVVHGKRSISKAQANALAQFFGSDTEVVVSYNPFPIYIVANIC